MHSNGKNSSTGRTYFVPFSWVKYRGCFLFFGDFCDEEETSSSSHVILPFYWYLRKISAKEVFFSTFPLLFVRQHKPCCWWISDYVPNFSAQEIMGFSLWTLWSVFTLLFLGNSKVWSSVAFWTESKRSHGFMWKTYKKKLNIFSPASSSSVKADPIFNTSCWNGVSWISRETLGDFLFLFRE